MMRHCPLRMGIEADNTDRQSYFCRKMAVSTQPRLKMSALHASRNELLLLIPYISRPGTADGCSSSHNYQHPDPEVMLHGQARLTYSRLI
jgi:hypothetical protein